MTDDFHRNVELYKRGLFDYIHFTDKITKQLFKFHPKQIQAIEYLNDATTSYVGYGGAARGGKSAVISIDAILCAHAFPECANLIGRKNLIVLWETTWKTLLRNLDNFGFEDGKDYKYNGQRHELTFANKSQIIAKNLELKPSDTEATEFGSLEILRAYVDQSEHVPMKIIEKVGERAGSHFTASQYNMKGKVLEAFNPSGSHVKRRYWTPFKLKQEKQTRKFVQALPSDNPGREAIEWVKQKEIDFKDGTMSLVEYQKQIKGNFDFDDDPNVLCAYNNILAMFSNDHVLRTGEKYITCDVARLGSDKARIFVWHGFVVIEEMEFAISKTTDIQNAIKALRVKHGIPKHNCVADEDGVGCLPFEMEVLTYDGWKLSQNITKDDWIVSKDENGVKEVVSVNCIIHHENEKFIEYNGMPFTSTHSHFYKTRKEYPTRVGYWDDITEKERIYHDTEVKIEDIRRVFCFEETKTNMPNGGVKKANNKIELIDELFASFIGWYLSEGSIDGWNGKHVIRITQSSKSPHIEYLDKMFRMMGVSVYKKPAKGGKLFHYEFQQKSLYNWIKENCYNGTPNVYNKSVPEKIKELSRESVLSFCKSFINGDGYYHKGMMQFVSTSKKMIDDIQEMLFYHGIRSKIYIKVKKGSQGSIFGRTITRTSDVYLLSEVSKNYSDRLVSKREYFDKAVNIKINNNTRALLVRWKGRIFWTHNGGVVDNLDIKGFVNNARPFKEATQAKDKVPQYKNLKTQCGYKLAELINKHGIYLACDTTETDKQEIIDEVDQLRSYKRDDDGKLQLKPKKEIKEDLGRSPDWLDTLFMRMYFELAPKVETKSTRGSLEDHGISW